MTRDSTCSKTATNGAVFEQVESLVTSVIDGYNVCIFAYGPTGSGKTYSMAGTREDPGIFNRTFEELFKLIEERRRNKWK